MPEPWYRPLAGLRDEFAACKEDLRHLLVTVDSEVCVVPPTWGTTDPGKQYPAWGMLPETYWRIVPGESEPLPIVQVAVEIGSPFSWKYTFYGRGARSRETFRNLAYRAFRCLRSAEEEFYCTLAKFIGLPDPFPKSEPSDPSLWWIRAVHGIARHRHEGSTLWSVEGLASEFHQKVMNFPAQKAAQAQGRIDAGWFGYSILNGDVFQASTLAIDIIRKWVVPTNIVKVTPLPGRSAYCDLGEARRWTLKIVRLSDDLTPRQILKAIPPSVYPAIDRYAYRYLYESPEGRYFRMGARSDFWHTNEKGSRPEFHYQEVPPEVALGFLEESGLMDDLSDSLLALLGRFLQPPTAVSTAFASSVVVAPAPSEPLVEETSTPSPIEQGQVNSKVEHQPSEPTIVGQQLSVLTVDDKAVALLSRWMKEGKDIGVSSIARELGVNRTNLYRCENFMALRAAYAADKAKIPRGSKDRRTRNLEAVADEDEGDE